VKDLDVGGQVFPNVSRIVGQSETGGGADIIVDIQCELYRLKTKDKFTLALANTLDLTGKPDPKVWIQTNEPSLLDKYDYGMYGKVFKVDHLPDSKVVIYVSHGGLLMKISGSSTNLRDIKQDQRIYTLFRKVQAQ